MRSYREILDDLSWHVGYRKMRYPRHFCETAMKILRRWGMVTTMKTTRGFVITVCNYDTYQNIKNYENHTEVDIVTDNQATIKPYDKQTLKHLSRKKKDIYRKKPVEKNVMDRTMSAFEEARKLYPGTKRGSETEFKNFRKKYPMSFHTTVFKLLSAIESRMKWEEDSRLIGSFIPPWPHFQTWINQARWEDELPDPDTIQINKRNAYDETARLFLETQSQKREGEITAGAIPENGDIGTQNADQTADAFDDAGFDGKTRGYTNEQAGENFFTRSAEQGATRDTNGQGAH